MSTLTQTLAKFINKHTFDELPPEVIRQAKEAVLDTLGCALAGADFPELRGARTQLKKIDTQKDCPIWGGGERASLLTSTLLNGMASHALEMDDVHKTSKTHTGAVVIPAAVTFAGFGKYSGRDLINAIVMGYETAYRIGTGINATEHRLQGWHATGVCCTFASAAAVGKLLRLDADMLTSALGMAGTQSSGLWALTSDGATCKKMYMGRAAQSGILSALLAQGGMTGPAYVLEAEDGGLYKAASKNYDFTKVTEQLGSRWEIMKADKKAHACCRSAQPPIDAALKIQKEHGVRPENVASIKVHTYDIAVKQCFNTKQPKNIVEAQLCIPYAVAVALVDGCAMAKQFTAERIKDATLLSLADKVDVFASPEFTEKYPQNWGCRLTLKTIDGQEYVETIANAKGDSDNPLSYADLISKFENLSERALAKGQQKEIIQTVMNLENVEDVGLLVELLG